MKFNNAINEDFIMNFEKRQSYNRKLINIIVNKSLPSVNRHHVLHRRGCSRNEQKDDKGHHAHLDKQENPF